MRRKEESLVREEGSLPQRAVLTQASAAPRDCAEREWRMGEVKALLKHCSSGGLRPLLTPSPRSACFSN